MSDLPPPVPEQDLPEHATSSPALTFRVIPVDLMGWTALTVGSLSLANEIRGRWRDIGVDSFIEVLP